MERVIRSGYAWVRKNLLSFNTSRPWIAHDANSGSIVGIVLVAQNAVCLVYLRPGATVVGK